MTNQYFIDLTRIFELVSALSRLCATIVYGSKRVAYKEHLHKRSRKENMVIYYMLWGLFLIFQVNCQKETQIEEIQDLAAISTSFFEEWAAQRTFPCTAVIILDEELSYGDSFCLIFENVQYTL